MEWLLSMPVMPPNTFFLAEREEKKKKNRAANEDGEIQRGASSDRLELSYGGGGRE